MMMAAMVGAVPASFLGSSFDGAMDVPTKRRLTPRPRRSPGSRQQRRDQTGPPGLVARPRAPAAVTVEVFVEQHIVPQVRVALQLLVLPKHWPPPPPVAK